MLEPGKRVPACAAARAPRAVSMSATCRMWLAQVIKEALDGQYDEWLNGCAVIEGNAALGLPHTCGYGISEGGKSLYLLKILLLQIISYCIRAT